MYDPAIARWMSVDPMAEKYYPLSPYCYCAGNPVIVVDPNGRAIFINKGKEIGNDGIDDGKVFVLKTTQRKFEGGAPGAGLSRRELRETIKFIKKNSGNSEAFTKDCIAYTNSIEIEGDAQIRQEMVDIVMADNGKGGTDPAQNREYGGTIQNGKVVAAPPGEVADPTKDNEASIRLPGGFVSFHSHPSGTKKVPNGTQNKTRIFVQPPSELDAKTAGELTHYVFGRGDGNVYVYTSEGVQAVIPMRHFAHPKTRKR